MTAVVAAVVGTRPNDDPAAKGSILFVRQASDGPGRYVVYRADVDRGTCERVHAVPSGDDVYPNLWPDGRHVLVHGASPGAAAAIVDTRDGSTTRLSPPPTGHPTWSRDGRTLAFVAGGRARFVDVHGRPVESFEPHALTPWSPNGRRVAFTRTTGDGREGTLRTVLVVAPVHDLLAGTVVYVEPNPYGESPDAVWSADGETLYFHRAGDVLGLNLATRELERTSIDYLGIIWAPDGRRGLFTATGPWGAEDVFVIDADGSSRRRLTTTKLPPRGVPQAGSSASGWSPDGEWIAYGRRWGLSIMRADGSDKRLMCRTPVGVSAGEAAWSFDATSTRG